MITRSARVSVSVLRNPAKASCGLLVSTIGDLGTIGRWGLRGYRLDSVASGRIVDSFFFLF